MSIWVGLFVAFLLRGIVLASEDAVRFTGCQLLAATPSTEEQRTFLHDLNRKHLPGVEFWNTATSTTSNATIQVCPEGRRNLTTTLDEKGIRYAVRVEDLQSVIDEEKLDYELNGRRFYKYSEMESFAFDQYHPIAEVEAYLDVAAKQFPGTMSLITVGKTMQGRPLRVVKLSVPSSDRRAKPIVWIDSGIHAREWVTITATLYGIHQMLTSNDSTVRSLLRTYDWYWMPVVNPDGYEYSWTHNRLWRKNRSQCTGVWSSCCGVDLNRNFAAGFEGSRSSSTYRCSPVYKGERAFSEVESDVLRKYVAGLKKNLKAFVTLHSYSQLWLLPYGYQRAKPKPEDYRDMLEVATLAARALEDVHGIRYQVGTIADVLYEASGSSVDWAYDTLGVKYSYCLELRDTGRYGFMLPSSQLIPTAEEVFRSLMTVAREIQRRRR